MFALYIILGILGAAIYLNIGYYWSKISWKVWYKKQQSVAALLCFPLNYALNKIGNTTSVYDERWPHVPMQRMSYPWLGAFSLPAYSALMSFIWPGKLIWNIPVLTLLAIYKTAKMTPSIITYPASRLLGEKKLPKQ